MAVDPSGVLAGVDQHRLCLRSARFFRPLRILKIVVVVVVVVAVVVVGIPAGMLLPAPGVPPTPGAEKSNILIDCTR